jgi:protocatechuate 3,4-dioxygenase alpha subunit
VTLPRTPAQTVGPYYEIGLCRRDENELPGGDVRLTGQCWARSGTDGDGRFSFVVSKPGALPGQAPRFDVWVHARGLLRQQQTRIYYPDAAEDPVLAGLDEAERETLFVSDDGGELRFDIRMQGERATVFFAH